MDQIVEEKELAETTEKLQEKRDNFFKKLDLTQQDFDKNRDHLEQMKYSKSTDKLRSYENSG